MKTMTPERIGELRGNNRFEGAVISKACKECLDEIERLQADNSRLQEELDMHAFEVSRPMLIARNDQLAEENERLRSCPTKPPNQTGS
jgi:hypothetical protein